MEQLRESAMKEAVCSGNWTLVKELLCRDDVEDRDIQESHVLHKLASSTDISFSLVQEIVEKTCLHHVDLHLTDDNGDTAVMAAARCGNWEIVRLLMSRKAALPDNTDHVIVFLRSLSRSENIRDRYMLSADILRYSWNNLKRKTSDGQGRTIRTLLIHLAAKFSCWWLVRDLATADLDLNTLHEDGYGVLHWLARNYMHSDASLLRKLLDNGADINLPNSHGDTALNVAAKSNNWEMFDSFLLQNANTAICNKDKQTVSHILAFSTLSTKELWKHFDSVDKLLKTRSQNINMQDARGNTALHLAIQSGNIAYAEKLLSFGARSDLLDTNGRTVLHLMATLKHLKYSSQFLKQVIRNGAKLETKDLKENTAAQLALECGNWSYVQQLKDEGADFDFMKPDNQRSINCAGAASGKMSQGDLGVFSPSDSNMISPLSSFTLPAPVPLDEAVQNRKWEYVKKRVKNNIKIINNPDKNGYTLLHNIAQVRSDKSVENVLRFLLNRGADVTARTPGGESLLHLAARHQNWLVVKIVLENKHKIKTNGSADYFGINIPDSEGLHILHRLAQTNQRHYRYLPNKGSEDELTLLVPILLQYVTDVSVPSQAGDIAIHLAAKHGNWKMVETIASIYAQQSKPISKLDREGFNILHRLTKFKVTHKKKVHILKFLFQRGLNLDCKCKHGETALQMAVKDQQWKFAGALVKRGADVHERDPEGHHILQKIATQNISADQIDDCISFITILHQSDVDFNVRCPNGDSFFQLAARDCNWNILEKLVVDVTPDINDVDTKDNEGLTVLHRLASSKSAHHVKLAQFLFEKGARCDILTYTGDSVMHLAAENNNWYIIKTFLRIETKPHSDPTTAKTDCQIGDARACKHRLHTTDTDGTGRAHFNIDVKDHSGNTILHLSAKKGKWDLVHKLLMFGSDATLADGEGHTVMYWLAAEDHSTVTNARKRKKVLQWLKISGVAVDEKDALGDTMIQVAAIKKNVDVVNILLDTVEDINMIDSSGFTILHRSVQWNPSVSLDIVKTLIVKEVDIECRCPDGNTALHLAAKSRNWTVVQMLLENGADARRADNQGRSVLHRFLTPVQVKDSFCKFSVNYLMFNSEERSLALVRLMVSSGANINSKYPNGLTPLQIASLTRKWSIVQFLLKCEVKDQENTLYILRELALDTHVDADLATTITSHLLRRGLNINEMTGDTPLNLAAEHQNWTVVRVFLEHGADASVASSKEWYDCHASSTYSEGMSVLHRFLTSVQMECSCEFSDHRLLLNNEKRSLALVRLMVSKGANINSLGPNGLTPVRIAIMKRKWSIVEFLLQCEAKVSKSTTYLFHELAEDTDIDADLATTITSQLLRRGLDINEMTGDTPLNLAAKHQNWTVVRVFLEHGADASIADSEGWFVCHRLVMDSSESNCSKVNQFILLMTQNGFQINQASRTGQSALQVALEREEWKIFWCLVQFGASCSLRFQSKMNILENVFQCPREMIKPDKFTQFMLHVTNKDSFSRSKQNKMEMRKREVLTKSVSQYNWPVATVLVQCGVDIRSSVEGRPLLHYVVSKYQRQDHEMWLSFLDVLLAHGVDINCQDRQGRTVLFDHSVYCSAECSQDDFNLLFHALIDRGANPLHTDRAGMSLFRYYFNLKKAFGFTLLKLLVQTGELTIQARLTRPAEPRAATRSSCRPTTAERSPTKLAFVKKKVLAFKLLLESGASSNRELFELANQTESTLNRNIKTVRQMLEVLYQAAHQPRTLKSLCRLTVLHAVGYGPQRIHRLMTLPFPLLLKKYLLFSDITL